MSFDRSHLGRDLADDRGGVARPGPDLEHLIALADFGSIDGQRNDVGLADGLPDSIGSGKS